MRRHIFAVTCSALALTSSPHGSRMVAAQAPVAPARATESRSVEVDALDRKADPCVDFYQFACGGWVAKNPVPADRRSFGRFTELQDRNFTILRRILESAASDASSTSGEPDDRKRAADYYTACMDESKIESAGLTPIAQDLATIDELVNPDDLPVLVAHLHAVGVRALFRFGAQTDVLGDASQSIADVDQGGLSLPDRDYYLKTDERSVELRTRFAATVEKMLALAGAPPEQAAADARAVLSLETTLATASLDRVQRRDPKNTLHTMPLNELQALTPNFSWRKYALSAEAPKFQVINVSVPDYLKAMDRAIASPADTPALKAYLRWHVLHESADLLPKAFADADFDFFSRTLTGQQQPPPRWRRCVTETDNYLGEALGKAFVEEVFSPQSKAEAMKMVQDIKAAMQQDIDAATWMTGETKKAAMLKLNAVVDRIGYPDRWRDYGAVRVTRDEALANRQRAVAFERARTLANIGQPVDRTEWRMTPPTVNAYYSPDRNTINFPAGILQPPFYRAGRDAAVNYGAAGAVIGHELTHGFDDQGRKFDGQGNVRDWWTPADAKAYDERVSCVADQYSGYTVAGDTKINGRLTLGENTADNGGLRLALMAYLAGPGARAKEKIDGFTPEQRVFLGYAQVWCENATPQSERLKAATNPHASNKYRVNGPLSNMPEFAKAFSCKPNAPMVRQNACRVW
jgi:endothelin-converting enzyme/putative endopeptidase